MADDQEQLLRQAVAGDEEALSELLKRYAPKISRQLHVSSTHLSKLDMEDILQVTFLEAFLNIRHFDPDRADSFSGWLLRIAENNLHDMVRELHRAKRPPPERQLCRTPDESCTALLEFLMADSATPSRRAAAAEAQQLVKQVVGRLPADYRRVVELHDLEGHSVEQVAKVLGRSPGAVYMLRARAHDRLREHLGSESRFFSHRA